MLIDIVILIVIYWNIGEMFPEKFKDELFNFIARG